MQTRYTQILAAESITTAGTKTIDINLNDCISRLLVVVELTNNGWTCTGHPAGVITKCELVDGSYVIASLSGYQMQAMARYAAGKMDHNELNFEDNAVCRAAMSIYFGRYLWDEMFALDPKRFNNLQLKITHNYALGGCTPDAATLAVHADVFDEKSVSPAGFMMTKEHYSYTPTAGAIEYIDLPTDHPIRMMLLGNTNDNEEPDVQIETLKISQDHDKVIPFDGKVMDLIRLYECQYSRVEEYLSGRINAAATYFYVTGCKDILAGFNEANAVDTYFYLTWTGGRKLKYTAGAAVYINGPVSYRCIHGYVPFPCGMLNEPASWWDVPSIGSVRAELTPRSASCDTNLDNRVVLQQLVT